MFNVQPFIDKLEERKLVLNWIIQGIGVHGLKITDAKFIDKNWIEENYNMKFDCNHKKVSEIGMIQTAVGKEYDGYCDICNTCVYGIIRWDGTQTRWQNNLNIE